MKVAVAMVGRKGRLKLEGMQNEENRLGTRELEIRQEVTCQSDTAKSVVFKAGGEASVGSFSDLCAIFLRGSQVLPSEVLDAGDLDVPKTSQMRTRRPF